jgi:mitochondrial import receptor subunit TOM7
MKKHLQNPNKLTIYINIMAIKLPAFILSDETREKINQLFEFGQKIAHYGWVPFVLYLGWQSNPNRPGLLQLLTPLPSA